MTKLSDALNAGVLRSTRASAINLKAVLVASDVAALLVAAVLANAVHWLYLGPGEQPFSKIWSGQQGILRIGVFAVLMLAAVGWFWLAGHYTRRRPFWDEIGEVWRYLAILAVVDATLLYLAKLQFSRFWFLGVWAFAMPLIPVFRALLKDALIARGLWQKPAVIVGTGRNALETARALFQEPMMGLTPVAFAAPARTEHTHGLLDVGGKRLPVVPLDDAVEAANPQRSEPTVFVALEQDEFDRETNALQRLNRVYRDLRVVPPLRGLPLYGATVHHLFRHELFFLTLQNNLARRGPRLAKRAFDLVASIGLLILLSPLFLYLILRIRQDGGPAFFGHNRIGQGREVFKCYKFRTMVPNAATVLQDLLKRDPEARAEWERDFKLKNDPRVTRIGEFLRRTSLDELPQLWNVLKGEMSLVGPRPVVAAELERYRDDVCFYLEAKPGMTGVWQVSGRNDTDYDYRVYLDAWYVKNWSLWYDIVILIKTVKVVLRQQGAY